MKRYIYPGMRFKNQHGDLCEFKRKNPYNKEMWFGTWLTSSSPAYEVGEEWQESTKMFWERVDKGTHTFPIPEEIEDKIEEVETIIV